jgi:hypothetical protein
MTINPPAPRSDDDTFDLIDHALAALAERRGLWLGDDAVLIHLLASLIDQAQRCLPEAVLGARDHGASWRDIATCSPPALTRPGCASTPTRPSPTGGGRSRPPADHRHNCITAPRARSTSNPPPNQAETRSRQTK